MKEQIINCPFCKKDLEVDSIREYTKGKKRFYWECSDCNTSIMKR